MQGREDGADLLQVISSLELLIRHTDDPAKIAEYQQAIKREISNRPRILQVAYDPSLCKVRELILQKVGFDASSVVGNAAAQELLNRDSHFDLVVVAWSAPLKVRREIVVWIKQRFGLRVVALRSVTEPLIPEADCNSS